MHWKVWGKREIIFSQRLSEKKYTTERNTLPFNFHFEALNEECR